MKDPLDIAEPILRQVDFDRLPASLGRLSPAQRHVFAVVYYAIEVDNGGHHQFLWNSTGALLPYTLEGLRAMGLSEMAAGLEAAAERLGGWEPDVRARDSRMRALPHTQDLDDAFYALKRRVGLDAHILAYARANQLSGA